MNLTTTIPKNTIIIVGFAAVLCLWGTVPAALFIADDAILAVLCAFAVLATSSLGKRAGVYAMRNFAIGFAGGWALYSGDWIVIALLIAAVLSLHVTLTLLKGAKRSDRGELLDAISTVTRRHREDVKTTAHGNVPGRYKDLQN